jgi:hypothetical protein
MTTGMAVPSGHAAVEHADGVVHAVDLDGMADSAPLRRAPVVCGRSAGVPGDEGGPDALDQVTITCRDCIAIFG